MVNYEHEDKNGVILFLEPNNFFGSKTVEIALKDLELDGDCNQIYTALNKEELGNFISALTNLYNEM